MTNQSPHDRCPTCRRRYQRSHPQNAMLWLLYTKLAETLRPDGQQYSAESYHTYYKSRFLGCDEVPMPNGKAMLIPKSTANLDVDQFSEYFGKVEADAAERGVYLDELAA